MLIREALDISQGITAVTGSGGKTTLLHALAEELPGRVILCTTTRMYPSPRYRTLLDPEPDSLSGQPERVLCIGSRAERGKMGPCRHIPLSVLAEQADYVLVEADGSRGLPLKAHAPWEPVIPPDSRRVVCVVGASGFGQEVERSVHHPEWWRPPDTAPASVAEMLLLEGGWDMVLVNQCDGPEQVAQARELAAALRGRPVLAASLGRGRVWGPV